MTVNEKPKKAVYTGDTIVNRLVNELGWYRASSTSTYLADVENASTDWWNCDVSSVTNGDMDVRINITNSSGVGVVSEGEQVIRWMMPTQEQQVINKLYEASYNGGTLTNIDGRKVVISLKSYGIVIDIYAKYE